MNSKKTVSPAPLTSDPAAAWLDLELAQWRSPVALQALQLERLKQLLIHAYEHVPYYHRLFDAARVRPHALRSLADFERVPLLTKAAIQAHGREMLATDYHGRDLMRDATGGSTGQPLEFYRDRTAQLWIDEAANRFRRWIGYLPEDRLALIWGASRDVPLAPPPNQRWLNSFKLDPAQIAPFIQELMRWQPRAIRGYASSLYLVAIYMQNHGLTASHPLAHAIESSAEKLWDWQRPVIEDAFKCRVYDMYGSREVPAMACECEAHAGLHVFSDIRLVEVLRDGAPAAAGQPGKIVVTDLLNYAMPLIRYEIGDVGALAASPCACGRGFPLLAGVNGRVTSTITLPDGSWMHGEYFTHLFYNQPGIAAFQVRQPGVHRIEVRVQPGAGFQAATVERLVARMRADLPPGVAVGWEAVAAIPPAPSGKFHFVISDVPLGAPDAGQRAPAGETPVAASAPALAVAPAAATVAAPRRPRVLLIADVPGWIFDRHCQTLARYLADEFDFTRLYRDQPYSEDDYDLIYPLEWHMVKPERIRTPQKYVTGIRSHTSWAGSDLAAFVAYLSHAFAAVHVVSRRLERIFAPLLPNVAYVTHGVDTAFFTPSTSTGQSARGRLRLGWAGNRTAAGKGFAEFIEPLGKLPGVELLFCGYNDRNLGLSEMRDFYNSLDAYVCASAQEGNNNSLLEAAAMERAIITTDSGTVPEYLRDGESALIVERDLPAFVRAVATLRDHPEQRVALGKAARQAVAQGWDWGQRAQDYRRFFRAAIERQAKDGALSPCAAPAAEAASQGARATCAPSPRPGGYRAAEAGEGMPRRAVAPVGADGPPHAGPATPLPDGSRARAAVATVRPPARRRPLRITYLISSILGVTGGNQTLLKQANALVERGHNVSIVTHTPRPAWFDIKAAVIQAPAGGRMAPCVPPSDVVISTYFVNTGELADIAAPVKVYYAQGDQYVFEDDTPLADPRAEAYRRRMRELSRASYNLPGVHFVANSRNLAEAVARVCGRTAEAILPVCTDQTIFRPLERPLPGSRPSILVVGPDTRGSDLEPLAFKGIADIRAALEILAPRVPTFTTVRIANSEPEIFRDFPCEYYYAPSDPMKTFLYGTAHILIYASHYDSCPRPPQEGMAAGAAVVCTATAGALEYCRDGENCLLVPVKSPEAIAAAVERLLRDDRLTARLVEGGLATARLYPREREWDELEALLYRFLDEAEGPGALEPDVEAALAALLGPGQAALAGGDLEGAAAAFAALTEQYPQLAPGYVALGNVLAALDRPAEAAAALRRAVGLVPDAAPLHNQLGVALYQAGDMAGAEAAFAEACRVAPEDAGALLNLVDLYRGQGRYAEATARIKDALRDNPNDPDILSAFGGLSLELGQAGAAQTALSWLQAVAPDDPQTAALAQAIEEMK